MGMATARADASNTGWDAAGDDGGASPPPSPGAADAALQALCIVARLHRVPAEAAALRHGLGRGPHEVLGFEDLPLAARQLGLRARATRSTADRLALTPLPALALLTDGRCVVLAQCDGTRVLMLDPARGDARPTILPVGEFAVAWSGRLLLVSPGSASAGSTRFDFSWFIPSLVRHRRILGEILVASACLQLFALAAPLFFQAVMDKVLLHRATSTLDVLVAGLVLIVVFESGLSALRGYLLTHTTSRIDVELGSRLFRHLMSLPLAYFQTRPLGDSVARVRELENIRGFLTGNALTLLVDLAFSIVFVGVMLAYSLPLTAIVLLSLPLYALLGAGIAPVLRRRLDQKFARGAESQALLVEAVGGVHTLKAGALEPVVSRQWDDRLAAYVAASFRVQRLAQNGHEAIGLVGKLVGAATLWYGAHLVMEQALSVGEFVAFNMFAQRVAQPILRMAQLWTDFQQVGVSMSRLADILEARSEQPPGATAALPPLAGGIRFERVEFRYRPEAQPVLRGLDLEIAPGEVVGIVGRSGSGKSTLAQLVQRLYVPQAGRVRIDGSDLSLIDPAALRRQVGVVLQENRLFNRSVRENIAIADPAAPMEQVIRAARLAGAHDFISELPEGYDTVVGEQGCGLSGGQRQRIAIARALFGDPRILILDEATSALDYESEAILARNMREICRGRTVLVIAHRLGTVRAADRILVMEQGVVAESGRHEQLLARPDGLYASLWALQAGAVTRRQPGVPA